ncbi:D-tyrosyl-tRNA deacylase [Rickenella mellea]|uniref:D-aminoacyl-tRNA deacylase n=1 Tax=Rickenella mellea TaxID=50990 RepID=A0A4Y7QDG8_9AGAM|nr:D-tyrosyl-tRNA deacylase [Rickenella mellea]
MRAVVQRVSIDNELISKISRGLMVLVGVEADDTQIDIQKIANKILSLRVFSDPENPAAMWKKSVKDIDGEVLCVSQFTLLANTTKGNKPDFHRAMATGTSREVYASFLSHLGTIYHPEKIKDGRFGAMMSVTLCNDGPVTFTLDSRKFEYVSSSVTSSVVGEQSGAV